MKQSTLKSLSFMGLITSLVTRIKADDLPPDNGVKIATTIRLDAPTKHYFELQAANLRVSVQDCMAMTLGAVMRASCEPQSEALEVMIGKIFGLFAAHRIAMVDIPNVVPKSANFVPSDMLSRVKIVDKLTSPVIDEIAKVFYVNPAWIKGIAINTQQRASSFHSRTHDTFEKLAAAKRDYHHVRLLLVTSLPQGGGVLDGLAAVSARSMDQVPSSDVRLNMVVLLEITKKIGNVEFITYLFLEKIQWSSRIDRHDTKLILMFCQKTSIPFEGYAIPSVDLESVLTGNNKLIVECLEQKTVWHPDTLLWNDQQNPELFELEAISTSYKAGRFNEYERAVKVPWDSSRLDPIKV